MPTLLDTPCSRPLCLLWTAHTYGATLSAVHFDIKFICEQCGPIGVSSVCSVAPVLGLVKQVLHQCWAICKSGVSQIHKIILPLRPPATTRKCGASNLRGLKSWPWPHNHIDRSMDHAWQTHARHKHNEVEEKAKLVYTISKVVHVLVSPLACTPHSFLLLESKLLQVTIVLTILSETTQEGCG